MSILLTPLALGYEQPEDAIVWHCKKSNDLNVGASPIPSPKIIPDQWKKVRSVLTTFGEKEMAVLSEQGEFGNIRVVEKNGEPWFVAKDVAKSLGYRNANEAVNVHCKKISKFSYSVSLPPYNIIPESDLYRLVMRSNLEGAEHFQDWVVEEVLPSIRKYDAYITPQKIEDILTDPDTLIRLATDLKAERAQRVQAEQKALALTEQVHADRPKVLFASSVEASVTTAKK